MFIGLEDEFSFQWSKISPSVPVQLNKVIQLKSKKMNLASKVFALSGTTSLMGIGSYIIWRKILGFLFLPSQIVYAINQEGLEKKRTELLKSCPGRVHQFSIPVPDSGYDIDAIIIAADTHAKKDDNKNKKVFIHLNANGVCYEDKLESLYALQTKLKHAGHNCDMLGLNYGNVGRSGGSRFVGASHLVQDAVAAILWARDVHGVQLRNIILHGHSIGGAAAILACDKLLERQEVSSSDELPYVLADRTFYSLREIVEDKLTSGDFDMGLIGSLIAINLSFVAISIVSSVANFPPQSLYSWVASVIAMTFAFQEPMTNWIPIAMLSDKLQPFVKEKATLLVKSLSITGVVSLGSLVMGIYWQIMCTGAAAGFYLGRKMALNNFALFLVGALGWNMEAKDAFDRLSPSRKLVVFHLDDMMIPSHLSLFQIANKNRCIQLHQSSINSHMYEYLGADYSEEQKHVLMKLLDEFFAN